MFLVTCVLSVSSMTSSNAQDFFDLMKSARNKVNSSEQLEIKLELKIFAGEKVNHQKTMHLVKNGKDFYYQVDEIEMIISNNMLITVDNQSRTIGHQQIDNESEALQDPLSMINIDSLIELVDQPKLVDDSGGLLTYKIIRPDGLLGNFLVSIYRENPRIKSVTYTYRDTYSGQDIKVVMDYVLFDDRPLIDSSLFEPDRFVVLDKKRIRPTASYQDYRIISTVLEPVSYE